MALEKGGFDFLSEQVFREVFDEGVLVSPCRDDDEDTANVSLEVTTGVKLDNGMGHSRPDTSRYYFSSNPIFQHILPSK